MEQHGDGDEQSDAADDAQADQGGPAIAAQSDESRHSRGAAAESVVAGVAALGPIDEQHHGDQGDEDQAEDGDAGAVE